MIKKFISTLLFLFLFINHSYSAVVNQVIVSVGDIAITSFDIQKMRDFDAVISQKKPSAKEALEKLISMASLLVIAEDYPEYYMDEAELRKAINNITNVSSDPTSGQRKKLYEEYSSLYRMTLRAEKVKGRLMYSDIKIKNVVTQPIPLKESQSFYNKNKNQFKDSPFPKFDLIIFAVESSPRWSLDELSKVEEKMAQLALDLDTSDDFKALKKKYSSLSFTQYSGRTDLFAPDVLILQKKIPDEILGIALQPSISFGPTTIPIKKNKGIYIPQPIPFRSTGKSTYLTMKIKNVVQPSQLTFDEALPRVEEIIKYQRAAKAIEKTIKERISEGQITLTPIDNTYNSVFKKFQ